MLESQYMWQLAGWGCHTFHCSLSYNVFLFVSRAGLSRRSWPRD